MDTTPRRSARLGILLPFAVALAVFLVYSGTLRYGFLNWDDSTNFLLNPHYRGLGWEQLRWMLTSSLRMGHYMPLTWLTFGLDFDLWGMNPFGYHLTNVLLHSANAAIFYFVGRRLLALAAPEEPSPALDLTAALAALFFALHPLRVESVAWVTERRDVLSGFFYLLSLLCYLKAGASRRLRWLAASALLFAFSLLSKISGITLPLILLILDIYPSGRLPGNPRQWFSAKTRNVWLEKIPFFLLALPAGLIGMRGQTYIGALFPLERWGVASRLSVALYGTAFYVWKTIAPWGLSPLYPLPWNLKPLTGPYLWSAVLAAAITAAAVAARRRRPAFLAAWACYLITLLPVSGLSQSGDQLAADRYTYIPCMGLALLAAAAAPQLWRMAGRPREAAAVVASLLLGLLGYQTRLQTNIWRDAETLWARAALDPENAVAQNNLGCILAAQGKTDEAMRRYKLAIRAKAGFSEAYNNLGLALAGQGKFDAAIEQYALAIRAKPDERFPLARYDWGLALSMQGKLAEAIQQYALALQDKPDYPEARNNIGLALAGLGKTAEAVEQYNLALQTNPDFPEARYNLALALSARGDTAGASEQYARAIQARPDYLDARFNLGRLLAGQGKRVEALEQFRACSRIRPGFAPAGVSVETLIAQLEKSR